MPSPTIRCPRCGCHTATPQGRWTFAVCGLVALVVALAIPLLGWPFAPFIALFTLVNVGIGLWNRSTGRHPYKCQECKYRWRAHDRDLEHVAP
jgi:uncharacterized membrane protein